MKIALTSIGCKLNQSEIQDLKTDLQKAGFIIVEKNQPHDLHIINACSITQGAEQITRQKIREIKRINPSSQIFVMGCLNKPIPEITKVFKNSHEVFDYIKKNYPPKFQNSARLGRSQDLSFQNSKTRALIKIQDGCNFNCSYCVITKFRGQAKSIPVNKIIKQIQDKEKHGYQEIVLVGVNILLYQDKKTNFVALVNKVLKQTNIPRIRFSSLDPQLISADFLAKLKNPRLCPHLHLSLQSGSNKILKLMNRHYTAEQYLKIVKQARKINPLASVTTDIIVGFPGETGRDFQETLNLVKKIDFLKIHIFIYSKRLGTKAAEFKNQIPENIKKERFKILNALGQKQKNKFLKKMRGKLMLVLFEDKNQGYTPNYIQIKKRSAQNLKNKIINLKI
ncbi:MAG: tRNA (N(6)-L-threonylcarbamoyladenosine(37)-C(2))-methylthiotransferase MtaB [Candidatus Parcubacteria bacterium]|nr:tRNA (N(6)-L-threonylcarbamoyladenosine(37)-C(2))-methylthiotransferase MtaB [Candidatus Parcubacteria bacterium]